METTLTDYKEAGEKKKSLASDLMIIVNISIMEFVLNVLSKYCATYKLCMV